MRRAFPLPLLSLFLSALAPVLSLRARSLSSTCARGAAHAHAATSSLAQAESKKYMRPLARGLEVTRGLEESVEESGLEESVEEGPLSVLYEVLYEVTSLGRQAKHAGQC